jgi:nucleotide-binding universal stress UspA family protein
MFRHILFPTDGSAISRRVAKDAIRLAKTCRAKLTALHVIPPWSPPAYAEGAMLPYPDLYSPEEYDKMARKAAAKALDKVAAAAKAARVPCDTAIVVASPVWKAIIATARSKRCDAIVMASHGRRGLEGVLLGSETNKVLTHSRTPVLVCR